MFLALYLLHTSQNFFLFHMLHGCTIINYLFYFPHILILVVLLLSAVLTMTRFRYRVPKASVQTSNFNRSLSLIPETKAVHARMRSFFPDCFASDCSDFIPSERYGISTVFCQKKARKLSEKNKDI